MADFKKGDTVRVKSGGPLMTVAELGPEDGVKCVWFDGKHREEDVFDAAVLKISESGISVASISRG